MVANSFDLWRKDAFFSAAEEVQESADIMESVYRTWVRERREGLGSEDSDELRRELQTALGTAKWQLEEFERAVRLSHGGCSKDNTTARHGQFVAAIEDQISRVEKDLKEFLNGEANQPLRWVNLNEEERDDLAAFLSGTPGTLKGMKNECNLSKPSTNSTIKGNEQQREDPVFHITAACKIDMPNDVMGYKEVVTFNKDANFVIELEAKELPGTREDLNCQMERLNGQRRTWSSPNFGASKIVKANEDDQRKISVASDESTKGKKLRSGFWKQKGGEHLQAKGGISSYLDMKGINWVYQLVGRVGGFQRQLQGPQHMQFSCSIQLTLVLMLTILLVGMLMIFIN